MKLLAPPPTLTVSKWATTYRKLSQESSAEPGNWNSNRAPYQEGMMNAVHEKGIHEVVFMTSAQIGKTEIINNIIGYFIHQDPATMLLIQPTLSMAESWSKDRFSPMLRDTTALRELIDDPKSRHSGNTLLHKRFPGGHITMAGANSPSSLASRPIRIVLLDEEDRYPLSAGTEGDPGSLAQKRSTTFWNRLLVSASTPTTETESRVNARYNQSDQRKYYVPCPTCHTYQTLSWSNLKFDKEDPSSVYYECNHCETHIHHTQKQTLLKNGEWRAEKPFNGTAGFHISELYSPWVTWEEMVHSFLKAKRLPDTLKAWVNTSLGETWKDETDGIEHHYLMQRKEHWGKHIPHEVLVITCGVDVQGDRLEAEIIGWGKEEESWSLQYNIIHGDPAQHHVWKDLDNILFQRFTNTRNHQLAISCTCIDSGGHHTDNVYNYCKKYEMHRIFAIKGASQTGKPLISHYSRSNRKKVKLFSIGTDTAKQIIYARLKIDSPGAGYCHFPTHYEEKYFEQLTAEYVVTKFSNGHPQRVWVKASNKRNEALDCRVYGLAALRILNPNLDMLAETQSRQHLNIPTKQQEHSDKWCNIQDNWFTS